MPVELSELMQLVAGRKQSLQVGDLPRPVAEYLKCHPAIVYLGHNEVLKIVNKHAEIKVEQLQFLPFVIKDGQYWDDPQREDCATVFYQDRTTTDMFLVGLKCAAAGGEVWVQTFFKISESKAKKRRARSKLLRDQKPKR